MLVYPAQWVKTKIFIASPFSLQLFFFFFTNLQAGLICAATVCEYQNSWLFSGRLWEELYFIHMQDPVRATAFPASWGFSLRQSVFAEQPCWVGRKANSCTTKLNINALCCVASPFPAQKPLSQYFKSYQGFAWPFDFNFVAFLVLSS